MVCLTPSVSNENSFLAAVQNGFPLVPRPFKELGERVGITESEAISMYERLKDEKIIRQTSAILDTKRLGYDSSLVAFAMDDGLLEDAAALVNTHPGVSHNYKREHEFNLWFTIAVPPNSKMGLVSTVELLAKKVGAGKTMILPTLKMFKIAVNLDIGKTKEIKEKVVKKDIIHVDLTPLHYLIIAEIQEDLNPCAEPFAEMISNLGIDYPVFFELLDDLAKAGYMRRYATILNHRQAGFVANAMVVWDVDDEAAHDAGAKAAEFSAVSHCYLRPRFEGWAYNLFTMIHASSSEDIHNTISQMAAELGAKDYSILTTLQEYKKVRIKYFTQDIYAWEEANRIN
jgi:DNA-binding Lrp family transcriptional regulator